MRPFCVALLCVWAGLTAAGARSETLYPPVEGGPGSPTVVIYSSLDEVVARPLILGFQAANPDVAVAYYELQTLEIHERVIAETDETGRTADLAFSSAMDLQMKLTNDGYAQPVAPAIAAGFPEWARWRDAAFGVTYEPAVVVYNKSAFAGTDPPRTRAALIDYLNANSEKVYGRVGTYDIERAGLGFFFLARDTEHNRDIWSLVEALGRAGVKLYSNSSAILERIADGRFVLGYNILGSYAEAWAVTNPEIGIVLPEDYTIVMSRIAIVPRAAANPQLGVRFLSFMLSRQGQEILAEDVRIHALHPDIRGEHSATALREALGPRLRPVKVGPGLLVYLDQVKRERLIETWNEALRRR